MGLGAPGVQPGAERGGTNLWIAVTNWPRRVFRYTSLYPKIAYEVLPLQAFFIVGCGCTVKNPGPAMLVYPVVDCVFLLSPENF